MNIIQVWLTTDYSTFEELGDAEKHQKKLDSPPEPLHCSFCGKSETDGVQLVKGPGVSICNECHILVANTLAQKETS